MNKQGVKDFSMPACMLTPQGYLTPPMIALLNAAFGFKTEYLQNTKWIATPDFRLFSAITLHRYILFNYRYNSKRLPKPDEWLVDWAGLIAHEQQHRDEVGGWWNIIGWYVGYGMEYIRTGFSYYNMKHEQRAYCVEAEMRKLMMWEEGVMLKVLQSNSTDDKKIEELKQLIKRYKKKLLDTTSISAPNKQSNPLHQRQRHG